MHVEEDEQVDPAIALVLTIVALKLARRSRNRLADFADELGWAWRLLKMALRSLHVLRSHVQVAKFIHTNLPWLPTGNTQSCAEMILLSTLYYHLATLSTILNNWATLR